MVHILWVFGFLVALNVEVSPPPKAFLHYSSRSSSASPLTNGSFCNALKFCPDGCWKAYSTLHDKGYVHKTVKHNKEFVLIWEHTPTELREDNNLENFFASRNSNPLLNINAKICVSLTGQ